MSHFLVYTLQLNTYLRWPVDLTRKSSGKHPVREFSHQVVRAANNFKTAEGNDVMRLLKELLVCIYFAVGGARGLFKRMLKHQRQRGLRFILSFKGKDV